MYTELPSSAPAVPALAVAIMIVPIVMVLASLAVVVAKATKAARETIRETRTAPESPLPDDDPAEQTWGIPLSFYEEKEAPDHSASHES